MFMMIKVLITGGTIDEEYSQINEKLIFTKSHLPKMLEQARCKADIKLETIMLKDSNCMNDFDRKKHFAEMRELQRR